MISIFVYFFSAIIILLAGLLVTFNWKINKNVFYLAAFLVIFALENSLLTMTYAVGNTQKIQYFVFLLPFLFLKAPFLFLFVRGVAKDNFIIKWIDLLHFLPFIIVAILNLPALLLNFQNNADISKFLASNPGYLIKTELFSNYPDYHIDILLFIQFLLYISVAFVFVFRAKKYVLDLTGQIRFQYQYTINRMFFILILILSITLLKFSVLFYFFINNSIVDNIFSTDVIENFKYAGLILYFLIPIYILLNPKFLFGLPHLETHHVSAGQFEATNKEFMKNDVSAHNLAASEDNYFKELSGKIMDYIDIEKPFLNKDFKIDDICKTFDVPHNHVQYCLNEIQQTKFNMLRNEKRVEYAKELLKVSYEDISIEEIGLKSGFTSVSSFYSTFKDVTGFTPVHWVKMNKNLKY